MDLKVPPDRFVIQSLKESNYRLIEEANNILSENLEIYSLEYKFSSLAYKLTTYVQQRKVYFMQLIIPVNLHVKENCRRAERLTSYMLSSTLGYIGLEYSGERSILIQVKRILSIWKGRTKHFALTIKALNNRQTCILNSSIIDSDVEIFLYLHKTKHFLGHYFLAIGRKSNFLLRKRNFFIGRARRFY